MNLPATRYTRSSETGMAQAARLMRALGPEAAGIWAELSADEVRSLSAAMDEVGDDAVAEAKAARQFSEAVRRYADVHPAHSQATGDVWSALSALPVDTLANFVRAERAAVVALILSRLTSETSARVLRLLPPGLAVETMQRLLHLGTSNPGAVKALEIYLEGRLPSLISQGGRSGHERVARIFDRLDTRAESVFLAALENVEPGAGRKVRALMFTFDDLAMLDAASLQTLLSSVDRSSLTIALKGAREATAAAFFGNMTQRAGDLLREEIIALGALRRSEIESARQEIVALARQLVERGDIRAGNPKTLSEDELVD